MPSFGKQSLENLKGVHPDLVLMCTEVIKIYDFSVIDGVRTLEKQKELFANKKTTTMNSKHLPQKDRFSHAVDLMPYKTSTNAFSGKQDDTMRFAFLAGLMWKTSEDLYAKGLTTHKLTWGMDWDRDYQYDDHTFKDAPHFELHKVAA